MKTLLLLRHAKSSWKEPGLDDHDRPLNKRGKKDAPRVGRLLVELDLIPDCVLSSTAKRARKTAQHILEETSFRGETRFTNQIYEASAFALQHLVRELPDVYSRVLMIGHNPGLEEFLEQLTGSYQPLTTAALARVDFAIDQWSALPKGLPSPLVGHWQPRELA